MKRNTVKFALLGAASFALASTAWAQQSAPAPRPSDAPPPASTQPVQTTNPTANPAGTPGSDRTPGDRLNAPRAPAASNAPATAPAPAPASGKFTQAQCDSMWATSDADNNGELSETEAARYFAMHRGASQPVEGGKLTRDAFNAACLAGLYAEAPVDPGAPYAGANSFTEGQARDRALAMGLTEIGELKKDNDGIWRGPAKRSNAAGQVAVDYKGNVVFK